MNEAVLIEIAERAEAENLVRLLQQRAEHNQAFHEVWLDWPERKVVFEMSEGPVVETDVDTLLMLAVKH
jgi:hypothetical protein